MNAPSDRRTFLRTALCCAGGCLAAAAAPVSRAADTPAAPPAPPVDPEKQNALTILGWLSPFVVQEERNLDRAALIKLLEERGRLCCRSLDFRQKLLAESEGNVDKLVEGMAKIVGPENCVREGNTITLVYPMGKCGCGRNPKSDPRPDDPYCECSRANNEKLFEQVAGHPVRVQVVESPRRGGKVCRFIIELA